MNRRNFLMRTTTGAAALAVGFPVMAAAQQAAATGAVNGTQRRPMRLDQEIEELQERTFRWFEKVTD
ncbi:MAG: Tat pathway signal protein, partial [Pseudomonadota bacterium]|nr:Tat pathway signal protein [Pseudomonadota bacterium]